MNRANLMVNYIFLILVPSILLSQNIPSSSRSREAITRVRPVLKVKLDSSRLNYGAQIFIRIFKEEKELEIWIKRKQQFALFNTYLICTYGNGTLGPKIKQGDGQAPEGFYYVISNNLNPVSSFHLSFNLGYPNEYDRYHKRTGSALMVHGSCVSIGCYAMTNKGIEKIYTLADAALRNGQSFFRVHIFPFRMSQDKMEKQDASPWIDFWKNLKEGYDHFENNKIPPNVFLRDGNYAFEDD